MSIKQVWLNLPVKDLSKAREFYAAIGFKENDRHKGNNTMASFFVGEQNFVICLFPEAAFGGIIQHTVTDTSKSAEVLVNIDAESREEVDAFAETVRKAGGNVFAKPQEAQGWMYAMVFADLDGHRWGMLHMDISKMPE